MASYGSYFSPSQDFVNSGWDYSAFKDLKNISPGVQSHLKRVYFTLACALVASALGVYLHLLWNIGGLLTVIGCMASIAWLLTTPPYPYNEIATSSQQFLAILNPIVFLLFVVTVGEVCGQGKRVNLLMAAAVCEGASLGPLVNLVTNIDPSIVGTALVGTSLAFACFSAAAILAQRREFMFLGGFLGSGLSILLWLNFASALFGGSTAIFKFEIYFGLLLFLGYIIFDTQMIIERADRGDYDYVKHSLELFTDFAAVFVRVLIIMTKNAVTKSEEEKKKQRD